LQKNNTSDYYQQHFKPTGTDYKGRTFSQFVDSLGGKLDSKFTFPRASHDEFAEFLARPSFDHTYVDLSVIRTEPIMNTTTGDDSLIELSSGNESRS
jgi:hypothetical protein